MLFWEEGNLHTLRANLFDAIDAKVFIRERKTAMMCLPLRGALAEVCRRHTVGSHTSYSITQIALTCHSKPLVSTCRETAGVLRVGEKRQKRGTTCYEDRKNTTIHAKVSSKHENVVCRPAYISRFGNQHAPAARLQHTWFLLKTRPDCLLSSHLISTAYPRTRGDIT